MSILVKGKSYPQLADLERALHRMMGGLPKQEQIKQLDGEELITFLNALGDIEFPRIYDSEELLHLPTGTILFDDTYRTYDADVDIRAIIEKMRSGTYMFVYFIT